MKFSYLPLSIYGYSGVFVHLTKLKALLILFSYLQLIRTFKLDCLLYLRAFNKSI